MAKIITCAWTSRGPTGKRVRHVTYGYHAMIDGKRARCVSAEWTTEAEALAALNRRLADAAAGRVSKPAAEATFGALAEEYLRYKTDHGKRSIREDRRILERRILPAFGKDLPARRLSEGMIAQSEPPAPPRRDGADGGPRAPAMAHEMAQSARIDPAAGDPHRITSEDSSRAPVAQVDRAAVS